MAELVARRAIGGEELLVLGPEPRDGVPREHVGRAGSQAVVVVRYNGPHERRVARRGEGDGVAEPVVRRAIGGE